MQEPEQKQADAYYDPKYCYHGYLPRFYTTYR